MSMQVKIDREKWSESSRRSAEYTGQFKSEEFYFESIGYRCKKCFCNHSFSPEQQKTAYEIDKKIIHYVPAHCPECKEKHWALSNLVKNYQISWNENRETLKHDEIFIKKWLEAVKEKNSFKIRADNNREKMLTKLLREL
jgi:hypothetical protein